MHYKLQRLQNEHKNGLHLTQGVTCIVQNEALPHHQFHSHIYDCLHFPVEEKVPTTTAILDFLQSSELDMELTDLPTSKREQISGSY